MKKLSTICTVRFAKVCNKCGKEMSSKDNNLNIKLSTPRILVRGLCSVCNLKDIIKNPESSFGWLSSMETTYIREIDNMNRMNRMCFSHKMINIQE